MRKPYSIWTPGFDPVSGGIRVLYGLMGWLLAKGEIAFVNTHYPEMDCIGIYPEIAHGNPLKAKTVVRYMLNKPGVMASHGVAGPTEFDKNDKIYVFSKIYDTFDVKRDHILFLPILNLNIFKDKKKKRTKTAYYVGKGKDVGGYPKNAIKITREIATNQEGLADLLNECQVMYSYEDPTAMNEIARLCGCPVKVIREGLTIAYSASDLKFDYEPGIYGIFYDDEKVEGFDSDDFRRHYKSLINTFSCRLDKFIEDTQSEND